MTLCDSAAAYPLCFTCCFEDASITRRRRKYKGNRRVKFVDGWVEFASKKVAKRVAASLHNTQIGMAKIVTQPLVCCC
jgi:hypothetical protein